MEIKKKTGYNHELTLAVLKRISSEISKQDEDDKETEISFRMEVPFPYNQDAFKLLRKTSVRLGYSMELSNQMVSWQGKKVEFKFTISLKKIWWDGDDLPF